MPPAASGMDIDPEASMPPVRSGRLPIDCACPLMPFGAIGMGMEPGGISPPAMSPAACAPGTVNGAAGGSMLAMPMAGIAGTPCMQGNITGAAATSQGAGSDCPAPGAVCTSMAAHGGAATADWAAATGPVGNGTATMIAGPVPNAGPVPSPTCGCSASAHPGMEAGAVQSSGGARPMTPAAKGTGSTTPAAVAAASYIGTAVAPMPLSATAVWLMGSNSPQLVASAKIGSSAGLFSGVSGIDCWRTSSPYPMSPSPSASVRGDVGSGVLTEGAAVSAGGSVVGSDSASAPMLSLEPLPLPLAPLGAHAAPGRPKFSPQAEDSRSSGANSGGLCLWRGPPAPTAPATARRRRPANCLAGIFSAACSRIEIGCMC
mmetsp:Transcript_12355/g.35550  ORF Transcript_12355/g.35550 Transcript_12355/m.35550 type:complete len:374 (-) Transcript_12355:518-1639(-)